MGGCAALCLQVGLFTSKDQAVQNSIIRQLRKTVQHYRPKNASGRDVATREEHSMLSETIASVADVHFLDANNNHATFRRMLGLGKRIANTGMALARKRLEDSKHYRRVMPGTRSDAWTKKNDQIIISFLHSPEASFPDNSKKQQVFVPVGEAGDGSGKLEYEMHDQRIYAEDWPELVITFKSSAVYGRYLASFTGKQKPPINDAALERHMRRLACRCSTEIHPNDCVCKKCAEADTNGPRVHRSRRMLASGQACAACHNHGISIGLDETAAKAHVQNKRRRKEFEHEEGSHQAHFLCDHQQWSSQDNTLRFLTCPWKRRPTIETYVNAKRQDELVRFGLVQFGLV